MAGFANVAWGYVGGKQGSRAAPVMYFKQTQSFATSEASSTASTANPLPDLGSEMVVRIILNEAGMVAIGSAPTAAQGLTAAALAEGGSVRLAANAEAFFAVGAGDKVAVRDEA